jgi:hypothetical protein
MGQFPITPAGVELRNWVIGPTSGRKRPGSFLKKSLGFIK